MNGETGDANYELRITNGETGIEKQEIEMTYYERRITNLVFFLTDAD